MDLRPLIMIINMNLILHSMTWQERSMFLVYVRFYKIIALTYCQGRCSSLPPVVAVARCRVRMAPANYCIILTCGVFLRLNCVLYVYVSTRSHSRYHILLFRFYKFEDVGSFV